MIIWRGHGWLVVVLVFGFALAVEFLSERHFGDDAYYQTRGWPLALALLLAGLASWLVGDRLERRDSRVLVDKASGKEVVVGGGHALFFVPMRWWGGVLVVLAAVVLAVRGW